MQDQLSWHIRGASRTGNPVRVRAATVSFIVLVAGSVLPSTAATAATPPIVPTHLSYPVGGTSVIGLGIDSANQNAQLAESVGAALKPSWRAEPPVCPQSAGSEPNTISVAGSRTVVLDKQYQCSYLSAYNTATGALVWRKQFAAGDFTRTAAVVGDLVYLEHDNANGTMLNAYDLMSGALKWSSYDGDEYGQLVNSIGSGLVTNENWADDAITGAHKFTISMANGSSTDGTSFVAGARMYYNADGAIQANSVTTGTLLWSYLKPGPFYGTGHGNALPALHDGLLYVRSSYQTRVSTTPVLNPATGHLVRTLPESDVPIAFDGQVGIFTVTPLNEPSTISAVNLTTGHVYWAHKLPVATIGNITEPTTVNTAPVIENGLVWILDSTDSGQPAHIAALDEVTGATRHITVESCASGTLPAMAVAQHRVFVSGNCGLLTYTG